MTTPLLILLLGLLACSALVSAAEAAVLSINKVRLRHRMEQGHPGAKATYELLTQLDHLIGTLLLANNVVNVGISVLGSWIFINLFGSERGLALATPVVAAVLILLCEVTPKLFAANHAEAVAFTLALPLKWLMAVLYPLSNFFTKAGQAILRALWIPTRRRSPLVTEEEIKVMIEMGREAGVLAEHELRLLHRIFEFSDSTVGQIMVPRERIAGVELGAKADHILDVLIEEGHSRVPVYEGTIDRIVGVIYARDVLSMVRHGGLFVLADLVRPVLRTGTTVRLAELLSMFQREQAQIAIVQDLNGRTVGLATLEDLLEEIVGEIREGAKQRGPRS